MTVKPTYDKPGTCIKCGSGSRLCWQTAEAFHIPSHLIAECATCGFCWGVDAKDELNDFAVRAFDLNQ